MLRKDFLKNSLLTVGGLATGIPAIASNINTDNVSPAKGTTFNMDFAPHQGMFKNHAGENFLDEIQFMYDHGFRSIEDNGFLNRPVAEQENIGNLLAKATVVVL